MLLSKILPQTSRNFTQIYLPYLRHYQTLHWGGTLRRHTWGGTFESNLRMFEAHFNLLPVKSASSDSYLPPTMVAVIDNLMDRGGAYWNLMPTVAPLYMMRYWGRHKNILSEKIQTSETHLGGGIIAVKMGGHICGNNFYRKYAPPEKSSHKTWQIYVIFSHLKCKLFCDTH